MGRIYSRDTTKHLMGWPPLMQWLTDQGVDPNACVFFVVADDEQSITVTDYVVDAAGHRIIDADPDGTNRHPRIIERTVPITSPPPDKADR